VAIHLESIAHRPSGLGICNCGAITQRSEFTPLRRDRGRLAGSCVSRDFPYTSASMHERGEGGEGVASWVVCAALSLVSGCVACGTSKVELSSAVGGEEPAPSGEIPEAVGRYTGIYEITAMTENDGACDTEGKSVLENRSDKMLVVRPGTAEQAAVGIVAQIVSCRDEASCRANASDPTAAGEMLYFLSEASDANLKGIDVRTGFSGSEVCTDAGDYELALEREGDVLRFQRRGVKVDYPSTNGMCNTSVAQKFAAEKPCNYLAAFQAKHVADL
jgi:hypothetical protein